MPIKTGGTPTERAFTSEFKAEILELRRRAESGRARWGNAAPR